MSNRGQAVSQALFGVMLLLPLWLGSSPLLFNDGDVSWHVAAGNWIIDQRAVPTVDPFSFTFAGRPWVAYEWLAEVIFAASRRLGGYGGQAAVVTLALVAMHLAVAGELFRRVAPWAAALSLIGMYAVLVPFTLARPHVLVWPLLAWWVVLLLRAREADRAPPLAAALIMLAWANLHPSWALGLAIAGFFGLEAALAARWRWPVVRAWGLFGLASLAAAAINANGLAGLVHPLTVTSLKILPLIAEWRPSNPTVTPYFYMMLAVALLAIAVRGIRLPPTRAALLVILVALALHQVRHQAPLAIVATLILPSAFARRQRDPLVAPAERGKAIAAGAALVAAVIGWRLATPLVPPENGMNPRSLIAAVPPELRSRPVLNGYSFGGPLILAGIRPYIDGRADMYGDAFVADYKSITEGDSVAFRRAVERYDIAWAMTPPRYPKLVRLLDSTPGWRRHYADGIGVIHVREGAP